MLRIIPHRLWVEPSARVVEVADAGTGARAVLAVEGLLCSACAAHVERRLTRLGGVRRVEVDLDGATARIEYDPAERTPEDLARAVEGAAVLRPVRRALAWVGGRSRGGRSRR